ncbi:hypothetical protein BH10PSE7_BH10PSE7_07490 [soil metagenome]
MSVNGESQSAARWLIEQISRELHARITEDGVHEILTRLGEQRLDTAAFAAPEARRLPACRYFPETASAAMLVSPALAAALASCEDFLRWKQNPNYSDAVMGAGYMNSYAYAELVGPDGFFAGDDFLLGLMILGPGLHYRDHYHAAPELYWLLTGPSDWKSGAGGYGSREAGAMIWHKPFVVHATRTLDQPLLTIWAWTRDVSEAARLVGA